MASTASKASTERLEQLRGQLAEATAGLADVSERLMFGCRARFVGGKVFAMVWKTGRLAFKLPEKAAYDELMALPGAAPWTAGAKTMAHWVLVPEAQEKGARCKAWARRAHALALAAAEPPQKKPAKAAPAAPRPKKRKAARPR